MEEKMGSSKKVDSGKNVYKIRDGFGHKTVTNENGLATEEVGTANTETEALNIIKGHSGSDKVNIRK
jgi:hypothetical protein